MRKGIVLSMVGLALLTGCGSQGNKATDAQLQPKWKGAPYRIVFDSKAAKPNPAGVSILPIKYTANPDALEKRVVLIVRFDVPGAENKGQLMNRMIASPVDIGANEEGSLPTDYMDRASKDLSAYLEGYCADGKVGISVALARSSLNPQSGDGEVEAKRLSDWLPGEVEVKKSKNAKCK